jgi:anti-anti-sigma factor
MSLTATLETKGNIATITLNGELDGSTAPIFKQEIDKIDKANTKKLVLILAGLEYMASAGLRVLIFAKQKMGADADIFVVGAQEQVLDTLEKTGYSQGVIIVDEYDAAQIEG